MERFTCVKFGTKLTQEFETSLKLVETDAVLPTWVYFVPAWSFARNPWADYQRALAAEPDFPRNQPLPDASSHVATLSSVWTHTVAKVTLDDEGNVKETDRLTEGFRDLFYHARSDSDYAKYVYMLSQNRKLEIKEEFMSMRENGELPPLTTGTELAVVIDVMAGTSTLILPNKSRQYIARTLASTWPQAKYNAKKVQGRKTECTAEKAYMKIVFQRQTIDWL